MGKLFGTDGIRGKANHHPMTAEVALRIGNAISSLSTTKDNGLKDGSKPFIIIGKDTRISGDMLAHSFAAGACAAGIDVYLAGVLPTPGISYLTRKMSALAGIVISASHNPYDDNGIKIFNAHGYKISDQQESDIEAIVLGEHPPKKSAPYFSEMGRVSLMPDASEMYQVFLYQVFLNETGRGKKTLSGIKMIVDCSNGSSYKIAPVLFKELGVDIEVINSSPDGKNINQGCGSEHPEQLSKQVVEKKAAIGLAFDGDADRLIAIDENGHLISGDQMIAIFARFMKENGQLKNNTVVTTVMSNVGLGEYLKYQNIRHVMSDVGDRNVVKELIENEAILGGEDSGHMVFRNYHTTGDGLLSAIQLLTIMKKTGKPLSDLSSVMKVYPQILENVDVTHKPPLDSIPEIVNCIQAVEKELGDQGRVLVRYSGTQAMCRVMVEGPTTDETRKHCDRISQVVKKMLG
ncbi:MAG: phosphoglucosamine mutase [Proteobacteria bacterium]|nr:phosphoglucosamine mutase [Pseudomonadota bacterium]